MATDTLRHRSIEPTHPGELLSEIVIPATGSSKAEIARLLGISRQTLYDILNRKQPVTPTVAVRLGKLFGDGAGVWLRMQAAYDTWHAERDVDVSKIPTFGKDLLKSMSQALDHADGKPVKGMRMTRFDA
jgi:addiction module HigA family antidote